MQQGTDAAAAMPLLMEKKELFLQYEALTDRLLEAVEVDDMEKYITQRGDLAMRIDEIDSNLHGILAPWGQASRMLLTGHGRAEELPDELRTLLEPVVEIMTMVRSIRMKNTDAVDRMERARSEAESQIKKSQNVPKISKYLNNLTAQNRGNNFGSV